MNAILKKKIFWISCIAVFLAIATTGYFVGTNYIRSGGVARQVRTVELQKPVADYQDILNDFANAELTIDGAVADFVGYKTIDASVLSQFDNLSHSHIEAAEGGAIRYHFTYDVETNVITIQAEAALEDGSILIDTISGVGFYDDAGEIDAVMNIDGDGILLSEMRNAGTIQNCGWFSNLIKAVAAVAAVVAVVAVVAAVVVVTVGAAAPAVVAAGVGVAAASGTAAAVSIATTCLTVAMVAAGVSLAATLAAEIDFQGIKYKVEEYLKVVSQLLGGFYYLAVGDKDGRMLVSPVKLPTVAAAALALQSGLSVYSPDSFEAQMAAQTAGGGMIPDRDPAHQDWYFAHYHIAGHPKPNAHAFYGVPKLKGMY